LSLTGDMMFTATALVAAAAITLLLMPVLLVSAS
jgi:hypothetical protein